jgi:hypothetical protein
MMDEISRQITFLDTNIFFFVFDPEAPNQGEYRQTYVIYVKAARPPHARGLPLTVDPTL